MEREPRPQRDKERREELDQQRLSDRDSVDRVEVRPLHEREPADAEHCDEQELPARDSQRGRPRRQHDQHETDERAGRPHLGQALCAEPRVLDHLDDWCVDREQRRGDGDHRVADGGALHRANVSDTFARARDGDAYTSVDGTWRSLVSAPALGAGGRRFESGRPDSGSPQRRSYAPTIASLRRNRDRNTAKTAKNRIASSAAIVSPAICWSAR